MPTTLAPAFFAFSGIISGTGFAIGNTTAFSAIDLIISSVTMFGAETPIKMSAPLRASLSVPLRLFLFVISAICACAGFIHSSPIHRIPILSHIIILPAPILCISFAIAIPAAPAPLKTTVQSSMFLFTTRSAFLTAAPTTTAVPCWSS